MRRLPVALAAALLVAGCGSDAPSAPAARRPVIKVSVLQSGEIVADGVQVTPEQLDAELARTRQANGVVWFYREQYRGVPPAEAMQVLNLTVKHALLVKTSNRADFSDLQER